MTNDGLMEHMQQFMRDTKTTGMIKRTVLIPQLRALVAMMNYID